MEFEEISEETKVFPGEFLLYIPKQAIVVCGAYKGNTIRALQNGRLLEDKTENFKKIKLNKQEKKERYVSKCKGCSGR
jgi:hypothetical protein